MSRCAKTDAILQVIFADRDLAPAQVAHAASCIECAHAVAEARRFDRDLLCIGSAVTEETLPAPHELTGSVAPAWEGRSMISRRVVTGAGIALVLVLAVFAGGTWLGSYLSGRIDLSSVPPEVVDAWVGDARAAAVAETQLGPGDPAIWEAVQVELCGDTAIAFYADPNRAAGYVWAIGRPTERANRVLDTGRAVRVEDAGVAQLRAMLPICEVLYTDPEAPAVALMALPIEPQTVALVPSFHLSGAAEEVPILVKGPDDAEVRLQMFAFFQGTVDDPSIRAIDIITESGRLRFPASVPGFVAATELEGERLRFEFRDPQGNIVAAGQVAVLGRGDTRRALELGARAEVLAEAERRALEADKPGIDCGAWPALTDLEQATVAAVVIEDLERVRAVQKLSAGTSPAEIVTSARLSIEKVCSGSPSERTVAEVARALYEQN